MEKIDSSILFRIIRYSFLAAIAFTIVFIISFILVFHTFFDIDKAGAITLGGAGDKNPHLSDEWTVIHSDDVNNTSRTRIINLNSGSNATASIAIYNDAGGEIDEVLFPATPIFRSVTLDIASTTWNKTGGYGPNSSSLLQYSPAPLSFIHLFDDFMAWKNNPSDDGDLANTVERMRLTADGLLGIGTETPATLLEVNGQITLVDDVFDSSWDGLLEAATKNAVFDQIRDISAKVTKSASQSISNNTGTVITWDSELYDTDSMHDNVTNNERITINTAGKYSALFVTEWEGNGSGTRVLTIRKNGSDVATCRVMADVRSQGVCNWAGELEVNDIITATGFQNSGGNLDFEAGVTIENTFLEAHKIN